MFHGGLAGKMRWTCIHLSVSLNYQELDFLLANINSDPFPAQFPRTTPDACIGIDIQAMF